jgi:hypothetical protein
MGLAHKGNKSFRNDIFIFSIGHLDDLLLDEKPVYKKNYKKIRQISKKVYKPHYYKMNGGF